MQADEIFNWHKLKMVWSSLGVSEIVLEVYSRYAYKKYILL